MTEDWLPGISVFASADLPQTQRNDEDIRFCHEVIRMRWVWAVIPIYSAESARTAHQAMFQRLKERALFPH